MKIRNIKNRYKKQGFTLIELLIVISLTALAIAGAYVISSKASDSKKVNVEVNNVNNLIKKIESTAIASDFSGLSNSQLATLGVNFTSEFQNPTIKGLSPKSYSITYKGLSTRQCADFAPKTQLKITSLQKVITKVNGQEFGNSDIRAVVEACNSNLNEVVLIVNSNSNTDLVAVGQDAPPPGNVTPGDLNIDPARPPSGVVPSIPHQDPNGPNIPDYVTPTNPTAPTSPPPTGGGGIPVNPAPPPINIEAPKPPPPPPPPSGGACGMNVMCCYDYRGGPKSYTCVAANRVVSVTCPAGSPTSEWFKTEHWKFDWHYDSSDVKEIIVTSSWYMSSVDDNSAHFCSIK